MPTWLDVGTEILNLDCVERFQVTELTKERKGRLVVEKAVIRAKLQNGETVNIAAFKNRVDAIQWMRTRLRGNEERVIQIR
ncbi:MAG: hypothetical protein FWF19_01910 [Euryarchaeota archaeon]|jgi:hypothetical protein|nr:hypothetical protein [Euryarchaeota archaeon]